MPDGSCAAVCMFVSAFVFTVPAVAPSAVVKPAPIGFWKNVSDVCPAPAYRLKSYSDCWMISD